ncbi:hypothetical protein [Streptomyces sp. NPDC002564]|uniref:hypothetical protein n=1 Tax=Streptomyces sp. NPDC002564 TaxID=3364649 RepID=UPI0036C4851D
MKARHLLMSAVATAAVLTVAGAPLAQAAPHSPAAGAEAPTPEWAKETLSFGPGTMRHTSTASGFTDDGTAYFTQEGIGFSPDGIEFSEISSHS